MVLAGRRGVGWDTNVAGNSRIKAIIIAMFHFVLDVAYSYNFPTLYLRNVFFSNRKIHVLRIKEDIGL